MTVTIETTVFEPVTATNTMIISPTSFSDLTTTVISHIATTLVATEGQSITITSPSSYLPVPPPTTKYTPIPTTRTSTVTLTEIDIYLQNAQGDIYSTWIIPLAPVPPGLSTEAAQPTVLVLPFPTNHNGDDNDWDSWSAGEKAGMIVGVVLGGLLLSLLMWWCCRRRNIWFAHGWWPWMGQQPTQPSTPGPAFVQPTYINHPVVPYGQGQPYAQPQGQPYMYAYA